jgi:ferredoxin-NADP reductase
MAIVKKYKAEIVSVTKKIEDIISLTLKAKEGVFKYRPGQFLHLAMDEYNPSDGWPESRCFSIQSPPFEHLLKITFAVKGKYTSRMSKELEVGKVIDLKLPYGDLFSQEHSKTNTVFIAGGTGITPFLSLFNDITFSEYLHPKIYLGFRSREFNIFEDELDQLISYYSPEINFYYQNENGVINIQHILKMSDPSASFFISGPPAMIKTFREYLLSNQIVEKQIKTDNWE